MSTTRVRRPPPPFGPVEVVRVERRSPYLVRVTLAGPDLGALDAPQAGASVRLLLPAPDTNTVVLPTWSGNVFLAADGRRAVIRTLTPLRLDPAAGELDVDVVLHGSGPLSDWAAGAEPGRAAAVSGTGRGYEPDPDVGSFVLAGDEAAIPAISTILPILPQHATVQVLVAVRDDSARVELPAHPGATVAWCNPGQGATPGDVLVTAMADTALDPAGRIWAVGEAAAMQRIRRHLLDDRGLARSQTVVRGYWKHGRAGDDADE